MHEHVAAEVFSETKHEVFEGLIKEQVDAAESRIRELQSKEEFQRDIERNFACHTPKAGQHEAYERLRRKAKELAYVIAETCPASRERSTAIIYLETALLWGNAAIARNKDTNE